MGGLWETVFFVCVVILGAALAWGIVSYNRRNRANEPVTEKAVREEYADTNTYAAKEDKLRSQTRS